MNQILTCITPAALSAIFLCILVNPTAGGVFPAEELLATSATGVNPAHGGILIHPLLGLSTR